MSSDQQRLINDENDNPPPPTYQDATSPGTKIFSSLY